jgi:hypothetical protein
MPGAGRRPGQAPTTWSGYPSTAIVTTDLGQPDNPPVEDGLALMADALNAAGFTDEEITTMIVDNSRLLAGADALRADPGRM